MFYTSTTNGLVQERDMYRFVIGDFLNVETGFSTSLLHIEFTGEAGWDFDLLWLGGVAEYFNNNRRDGGGTAA